MNTIALIEKYFPKNSLSYYYYYNHVISVARFAVQICRRHPEWHIDEQLVYEAAMLHDIGISKVNAPKIGCMGSEPYICHGILGAEIVMNELQNEAIARICERHVGLGITLQEIEDKQLPLPKRDMTPQTLEEEVVCYADKFFSKTSKNLVNAKSAEEIRKKMELFGNQNLIVFDRWVERFGLPV